MNILLLCLAVTINNLLNTKIPSLSTIKLKSEGESNVNLKYVSPRNLLNTKCTQWLHFSMYYRTATCQPLFKPWVSRLKLSRQRSCVSNFYSTFKFSFDSPSWQYGGISPLILKFSTGWRWHPCQGSPGARWTGCCLDTTALGRHFEAELYFMHLPGFEP